MDNELYDYSPITRAGADPLAGRCPGGFLRGPERRALSHRPALDQLLPGHLGPGTRSAELRVARLRRAGGHLAADRDLDRHGIRASVLLNSDVARALSADHQGRPGAGLGVARHGRPTPPCKPILSTTRSALPRRDRRHHRKGHRAGLAGWLGPGLTETFQTPGLLAELGLSYVLDWTNDDQPYPLNVPGMLSVPYSVELNDIGIFTMQSLTGPDFVQIVKDQVDQLYADSADSGRVMALALHPFVIGQPFRHKYLDQALDTSPIIPASG